MPDESPHQPHDKIFKWTFSQKEAAVALFKAYLPERLTRHLDLRGAELIPATFIDEQLRGSESDLLYRIPCQGKEVFVYRQGRLRP